MAPPLTAASICGTPPCFRKEELWRLRGAKYVQSDLEGVFREVRRWLDQRPVLFSGTPCQVDGLYRYLGGRPENLTTCDLVCHGVPSPGVWEDMARSLEARRQQPLQAVRFLQQGRRMEGQPFHRGLRRRHRGYRAAVPHGIRPGPSAGRCSCGPAATAVPTPP